MRYVIVIAILCTVFAAWLAIDTLRAVPSDASINPAESRAGSLPVPSPEAVFAVQSTPKAESAERQNSVEDPYGSANIRWAREDAEPVPFRDTARGILTRDPFDQAALTVAFADAKRDRDARLIAEYGSRLMQLDPENLDLVFDCVTALVGVNRLPDASRILAEARARFPESDALRRNFATIEQAQGRVSSAIGVWSQVLAEDPEDAQALAQRGLAYLQIMDWVSAREDLERAYRKQPANVEVALDLVKTYENLSAWDEAGNLLQRLHEQYPRDVRVLNQRALLAWQRTLRESSQNELTEILSLLDQSLAIAPGQAEVIALRARAQRLMQRTSSSSKK